MREWPTVKGSPILSSAQIQHTICCFHLHHAVLCLTNVNINIPPAHFYCFCKENGKQLPLPRKHVQPSLGSIFPVHAPTTRTCRLYLTVNAYSLSLFIFACQYETIFSTQFLKQMVYGYALELFN